jgi:hypothetical protein
MDDYAVEARASHVKEALESVAREARAEHMSHRTPIISIEAGYREIKLELMDRLCCFSLIQYRLRMQAACGQIQRSK